LQALDGPADAQAVTLAQFLADDGRLLDALLARWRANDPCDPPE
jgi:hypothetical protein